MNGIHKTSYYLLSEAYNPNLNNLLMNFCTNSNYESKKKKKKTRLRFLVTSTVEIIRRNSYLNNNNNNIINIPILPRVRMDLSIKNNFAMIFSCMEEMNSKALLYRL